MASKKDKLLENAQRFVLKGQIDKAIKEYQQLVALDPREIRFRQRLAELLVRDNRKEEAISEYEDIGKHYADNSYFLKAIAVYKQIQRLDSANPAVSHTLAVLNQRQGLAGNALAEYNHTVRLLEQQGDLAQAVKVVKEMLALDADNSAVQLKHAELLYTAGDREASYLAFSDLLKRLVHSGGEGAAEKVSSRMGELFPDRDEHQMALLSLRIKNGDVDGALAAVRQELARNEKNLPAWRLLCDVLRRKGEKGEVQDSLERMAHLFPSDPAVLTEHMRAQLEGGNFRKVAGLALGYLDTFMAAGQGAELEQIVVALPSAVRGEAPVQEGLRRLYEASGDWEKLNALRAPVLQSSPAPAATAAPVAAAPAPPAADPPAAWEEEIDLDFEEELAPQPEDDAPGAPSAPQALELDWPEEPAPFLAQEPPAAAMPPAGTAPEPADLPWGELDLEAAAAPVVSHDTTELPAFGEIPGLELSFPEEPLLPERQEPTPELPVAQPEQEAFTLELDFPEESTFLDPPPVGEVEAAHETAPAPQEPLLTWDDIFPGCLGAQGSVDPDDAESHYDLGIAYMEMGRLEAALKEFSVAAANPKRRLDCLILEGMSYRGNGEEERAEELFRRGLQVGELTAQERVTLGYELASLYEEKGAVDLALPLYREINALDPSFRDVALKLSLLAGEEPLDVIDLELEEVL